MADKNYEKYQKNYSDDQFWSKAKKVAKKAGAKVIYVALLLYYVLRNPATPKSDRAKILGALGYFILPIDAIPDFIPVAGFTDDFAALTWALICVARNITPEVKVMARQKLGEWIPDYDSDSLDQETEKIVNDSTDETSDDQSVDEQ